MTGTVNGLVSRVALPATFFGFLAAMGVSRIGDSFRALSLDLWFYEGAADKEAARLTLLLATIVPALILGPIAGAVADRWDLRRTFLVTNLVRGVASLGLAGIVLWGGNGVESIALIIGASIATVFFSSSAFVFVPRLVSKQALPRANGISQSMNWAIASVGPALAAGAFALWGAAPAFLIDSASFFIAAVVFARVIKHQPAPASSQPARAKGMWQRMRSALQEGRELGRGIAPATTYLLKNPPALGVLIGSYGVTITAAVNSFSLIFLVAKDLDLPPEAFGVILSLNGVVAVVASLLVGFIVKATQMRLAFIACLGMLAVSQLIMGISPNVWILGIGVAVSAFVNAPYNVAVTTLFQTTVTDEYLGRVEGLDTTVDNALKILVLALAAVSVAAWGARPALIISGLIAIALCLTATVLLARSRPAAV